MAYEFKRGATISLPLEIVHGDFVGSTATATLKKARLGQPPGDRAPAAATFVVLPVDHVDADDDTSGPGWLFGLSETQTAALDVGSYVCDARVVLAGGDIVMAPTLAIAIVERVTEPAGG